MSTIKRTSPPEIDQDLRFQQAQWKTQRWAWLVLTVVLVAGLIGVFGRGPLSWATAATDDGALGLEYERFLRRTANTTLTLTIDPDSAPEGLVRLWIDRDYLDKLESVRAIPRPEREETGPDRQTWVFRLEDPAAPARVTLHLVPQQFGPLAGRLGLDRGPTLEFGQFVYP